MDFLIRPSVNGKTDYEKLESYSTEIVKFEPVLRTKACNYAKKLFFDEGFDDVKVFLNRSDGKSTLIFDAVRVGGILKILESNE